MAGEGDERKQNRIKDEEMLNERPEDVELPKSEQVKNEEETSDGHTVETDSIEELESDDEGVTTPQNASVVKYSIKTTPYLQR